MSQGVSGETRPRPNQFKLTNNDGGDLEKGKVQNLEKNSEKYYNMQNYMQTINKFVNYFDKYLDEKRTQDLENKHTIWDDLKKLLEFKSFNDFAISTEKKSKLFEAMYNSSAKMMAIIINILKSKGPVLVYSNYVLMEGLELFKVYLKYFNFSKCTGIYGSGEGGEGTDGFRYIEYHGSIDLNERRENVKIFNHPDNITGKICKIIMISPAGSEGLSLENVRQVHIMEPYWHEIRIQQMIGRAIRQCSHKSLPMEERYVDVYRYKSVRRKHGSKWTTDQRIEDLARSKNGLITSFLDALKEVAIDCELYKAHNKLEQEFRCFQFEEPSLFDTQIGPAYKEDIYDDFKLDNGLNSKKSGVKRIKVLKISAVIQLSPIPEPKYSKPETYWYNSDTHVVYDIDLYFAIGKIALDDDNLPIKLDNETFIINKMIPIPKIIE